MRLDVFLAARIAWLSRSSASRLIEGGKCTVGGKLRKPAYRLKAGDTVMLESGSQPVLQGVLPARPIPFRVVFEDRYIIVVDKPAGVVVHPAAGHSQDTLVNGLILHCPQVTDVGPGGRPGIVHRLDKDTSGLMVVAKTSRAHQILSANFKQRRVEKKYLALVHGQVEDARGVIDLPIGRHLKDRKKMATNSPVGRQALTLWRVRRVYGQATLLELDIKTGRTHQIRVHCRSMGHPVVGDTVYGFRREKTTGRAKKIWQQVRRQLLHAWQLGFEHPVKGQKLVFRAPVPQDFRQTLAALARADLTTSQ